MMSIVAALGLVSLGAGFLLTNIATDPRSSQVGIVVAGTGIVLLAAFAVVSLIERSLGAAAWF